MKKLSYFNDELLDQGILQIKISEEDEVKPISGVKIQIIQKDNLKVIEELITDISGKSKIVELATPPLEYSLDEEGRKPYCEYNIKIIAENFEPLEIHGVQILPSSKALQIVKLRRIKDVSYGIRTIPICSHRLWGNYPSKKFEDEVKNIPSSIDRIALLQPIIPQNIIVHLGNPYNDFYRNVCVPFKDYIKNVVCSEIYPTWPRESIKASTLAIISFALNRVYSNWYKDKGYNFDITNSTLYDQAFVYGRNIFESISNIVNEIFTTYIAREDIKQPLLAQHCDGVKNKSGKGMKHWGSKKSGEKGLDSLTILKEFYGEDINTIKINNVQGIPMCFVGENLIKNTKGVEVKIIQEKLNAISNNYLEIAKLKIDGVYGEKTIKEVKCFQKIFNMPVTGMVDFATWYEIAKIYVEITKLVEPVSRNFHNICEPYRY